MTYQEIATAFSNGRFESVFPYFSATIQWTVVGENQLDGKEAVMENCRQVAAYFNSVTTVFKTESCIVDQQRVAIEGTAEFLRDGRRISFVRACDVYVFNDRHELEKITSYCITEKN